MNNLRSYIGLLLVLTVFSCKKNEPAPPGNANTGTAFPSNVFVLNEGNFGSGNADLTWINRLGVLTQGAFQAVNARPLGDVGQSIAFYGGNMYIIVNNSQKIEVANESNLNSVATITGFVSPRFMAVVGSTGYVTDWGCNCVRTVDLTTQSLTGGTIAVGSTPEEILAIGSDLFVANNGFGTDSTIMMVNSGSGAVIDTFYVSRGPSAIRKDRNGDLWVLCSGDYGSFGTTSDDIGGALHRIDPVSGIVEFSLHFASTDHPSKMDINGNGDRIYFLNNGIWYLDIGSASPVQVTSRSFYGIAIEASQDRVYVTDPLDYMQNGWLLRYDKNGSKIDSFRTGLIPGSVWFR